MANESARLLLATISGSSFFHFLLRTELNSVMQNRQKRQALNLLHFNIIVFLVLRRQKCNVM